MTGGQLEAIALEALARAPDPVAFATALVARLPPSSRPHPSNVLGNAFIARESLERGHLKMAVRCAVWSLAAQLTKQRVAKSRPDHWNHEYPIACADIARSLKP